MVQEIILHTLFSHGTTRIQDLERYITDDVLRHGNRLLELEKKLANAYAQEAAAAVENGLAWTGLPVVCYHKCWCRWWWFRVHLNVIEIVAPAVGHHPPSPFPSMISVLRWFFCIWSEQTLMSESWRGSMFNCWRMLTSDSRC